MTRVLLQTTIPYAEDDWHIGRFSMLCDVIASMPDVEAVARNREPDSYGSDPLLTSLDRSPSGQLCLLGVDGNGNGLTASECAGITAFVKRGGAILATRDHEDCGASICTVGGIGAMHYFHSRNLDPDPSRRARDDRETRSIDWPNYHSGNNGDYQHIEAADHPLFQREDGSRIEWFPSHPHEGAVGAADDAHVIAQGQSETTGRPFNLIVAMNKALAHSSFHHFCDYNWDIAAGCPSFVEEAPGSDVSAHPERLNDVKTYVRNAVRWLSI